MTAPDGIGKDDLFRSLFQKYYWRMVRFYVSAFRLSQEDAQDLAQEAFLRFYEAMDEYRGEAEWALLEIIGRNVLFNKIRAQKTVKRSATMVDIDDPNRTFEPIAPEEPDYAERQYRGIQRKRLYEALAELPHGQRQCMQLWLQGRKYDEIARTLRISLDAVRSRLRDAKKLLRERLGDGALPEEQE